MQHELEREMEEEKRREEMRRQEQEEKARRERERSGGRFACFASRIPLVLAALALIISVVVGFGVTQNISGMREEVVRLSALSSELASVAALREEVAVLSARLESVGDLETAARKAAISAALEDLTHRTEALAATVGDAGQEKTLKEQAQALREMLAGLKK